MASARILKHWTSSHGVYELTPRPTEHDRQRAVALLREAAERAEAIIAEAQAQAEAIRLRAQADRETTLEASREAALRQARTEVQAEFAAAMDESVARFQALTRQAVVAESELRRACGADLVALAIAIAERVIGREIATDPTLVEQAAARALAQTQSSPLTRIMVHPDDVEIVRRWAGDALGALGTGIEITADPHVGPGGCVIGTKTGFIDARIETQLAEVRAALAEVIEDE